MHEVAHFRKGEMTRFKVVWNLLAGIPMLTPSFFYEPHLDHHNTRHYGTAKDGEYIPFIRSGWGQVLWYASQPFVLPLLTAVRFLIVTPLSFLSPSLRRWTLEHWSSFVIDLQFKREIKESDPVKLWALIEVACHLRTVALFAVPMLPFVPWYQFLLIYVIAVSVLTLNHLRTLTAHRFKGDGHTMSHAEQLFDSNDIVGDPIFTEILMPVGLRFHALHHLFPGMPYHNLKKAHLRLMEQLPEDAPYRSCVQKSFFSALAQFYRDMSEHRESRRSTASRTNRPHRARPSHSPSTPVERGPHKLLKS
jgi:fatty acid desaturase